MFQHLTDTTQRNRGLSFVRSGTCIITRLRTTFRNGEYHWRLQADIARKYVIPLVLTARWRLGWVFPYPMAVGQSETKISKAAPVRTSAFSNTETLTIACWCLKGSLISCHSWNSTETPPYL